MRRRSFLLVLCWLPFWSSAQVQQDTLLARLSAFRTTLARLYTITPDELAESDWAIHSELAELLIQLVGTPGLTDQEVDDLVPLSDLYHVRSPDGRLCIFSWDERTGGTFQSQVSVVFHRLPDGQVRGSIHTVDDNADWNTGGSYRAIHSLRSDSTSRLYACVGSVKGCGTCCGDMLTVIELTSQGINFNYPAFVVTGADGQPTGETSATFLLNTRCGDALEFVFDTTTNRLIYSYVTDDLTPVAVENMDDQLEIIGSMRFDGERFEEE